VTATIPVGIEPAGVAVSPDGGKVYVTNFGFQSKSVSVISAAKNKVTATIPVGIGPVGVVVSPDGSRVYVANYDSATVSVITTKTNKVTHTIPVPVGMSPVVEVAVSPDGSKVYVTTPASNTLAVIYTAKGKVITTIPVGMGPIGVVVSPDGSKVYVTNSNSFDTFDQPGTVSVIDTANNTVTATIPVGATPGGVSVSPEGRRHDGDQLGVEHRRLSTVYVANAASDNVSVINTANNTVIATIPVGERPVALGLFIQPEQPAPRFAGTPEKANCYGQSVSELARQYHGLNAAAAAQEFSSVRELQNAISEYCEG
jgi:YVTN family beta-propeller protein